MSRKTNFINNAITLVITLIGLVAVVLVADRTYSMKTGNFFLLVVAGALVGGFFTALLHETGHLLVGKLNGFAFLSMTVWFFNWKRERGKIVFSLVPIGEEAGYTEMAPKSTEDLERRFVKMTRGGLLFTLISVVIGAVPFVFLGKISAAAFTIFSMFLPMGLYYFFGNALPYESGGEGNDGKVLIDIKRKSDDSKVFIAMLKIQSELFNGKTPGEIDEKYYFDVPQLPEDDMNFVRLLTARYAYYVDKGEYAEAKAVTDRLLSLEEYLPRKLNDMFKTYELYNSCTFDFNAERADEIVVDVGKYLDKHNGSLEIRAKMAYILYVKEEKEDLDMFYKKAVLEANKCNLRGLGVFERKLVEEIKKDF